MTILLNGESQALAEPAPLQQLLDHWGYVKGFAVAVNGGFVPRSSYGQTLIQNGDEVEILTPMQGG